MNWSHNLTKTLGGVLYVHVSLTTFSVLYYTCILYLLSPPLNFFFKTQTKNPYHNVCSLLKLKEETLNVTDIFGFYSCFYGFRTSFIFYAVCLWNIACSQRRNMKLYFSTGRKIYSLSMCELCFFLLVMPLWIYFSLHLRRPWICNTVWCHCAISQRMVAAK